MPQLTKAQARQKGIPSKTLQTILLDKHYFTIRTAKKWLKDHNFVNSYWRATANEYRFLQTPDIKGAIYYSKKIDDGQIILVFQEY